MKFPCAQAMISGAANFAADENDFADRQAYGLYGLRRKSLPAIKKGKVRVEAEIFPFSCRPDKRQFKRKLLAESQQVAVALRVGL